MHYQQIQTYKHIQYIFIYVNIIIKDVNWFRRKVKKQKSCFNKLLVIFRSTLKQKHNYLLLLFNRMFAQYENTLYKIDPNRLLRIKYHRHI